MQRCGSAARPCALLGRREKRGHIVRNGRNAQLRGAIATAIPTLVKLSLLQNVCEDAPLSRICIFASVSAALDRDALSAIASMLIKAEFRKARAATVSASIDSSGCSYGGVNLRFLL